jgi:hypothetical protein
MTIDGGPSLLDDPGDLVLSIEVPDGVALANEIHEEPPLSRPFRVFWFTPEEANPLPRHTRDHRVQPWRRGPTGSAGLASRSVASTCTCRTSGGGWHRQLPAINAEVTPPSP